jgi:hypothetical protein
MQQMLSVCYAFFPAQIAQMQLHALAVWALLLQERGHPALVPVVFYFIMNSDLTNGRGEYIDRSYIKIYIQNKYLQRD